MLAQAFPRWLFSLILLPVLAVLLHPILGNRLFLISLLLLTLPFLFVIYFFRDPEREVGQGIVSPADGRITAVERVGNRIRISIFMSPFDVHVNRAPLDGTIRKMEYTPGAHTFAFSKDSDANERLTWRLTTQYGEVVMIQIAGAFARRIVPYRGEGERVRKGERIGMIMFGSRVDLILPQHPRIRVVVNVREKVKAASTVIAEVV
ncbi:MAG: phosphatidylserine decarboxylase [Thermoplasmata archaeon]|nr:phosphatidylserine decarboxylase [Thermoplasmata archaeon]